MTFEGLAHSLGLGKHEGVSERATVVLTDLTLRRTFQNEKTGARVRIMSLSPIILLDYSVSDPAKQQLFFGSLDELKNELEGRGLQPAAIEETPDQSDALGASGAQVIDIAAKRAERSQEVESDGEKLTAERTVLDEKLLEKQVSINQELLRVAELLNQSDSGNEEEIEGIQRSINEFSDRASGLMRDDEAADTAQGTTEVTTEFLAAKEARLQNLEAILSEVQEFSQEVRQALQAADQVEDESASFGTLVDTNVPKKIDKKKRGKRAREGDEEAEADSKRAKRGHSKKGVDSETGVELGGAALAHGGNLEALLQARSFARPAVEESQPVASSPLPPEAVATASPEATVNPEAEFERECEEALAAFRAEGEGKNEEKVKAYKEVFRGEYEELRHKIHTLRERLTRQQRNFLWSRWEIIILPGIKKILVQDLKDQSGMKVGQAKKIV